MTKSRAYRESRNRGDYKNNRAGKGQAGNKNDIIIIENDKVPDAALKATPLAGCASSRPGDNQGRGELEESHDLDQPQAEKLGQLLDNGDVETTPTAGISLPTIEAPPSSKNRLSLEGSPPNDY